MKSLSNIFRAWLMKPVTNLVSELHRVINMNRSELIERLTGIDAALAALDAGVNKIGDETRALQAEIADLTTAVENAGNTTPEIDAALAAVQARMRTLEATVQSVDDLVPDVNPEPPAP